MNFIEKNLKQKFDDDGYLAIYSFFEDNKIEEIKNEIDRYISEIVPTLTNHHVFYEDKKDKSTNKQMKRRNWPEVDEPRIRLKSSFIVHDDTICFWI